MGQGALSKPVVQWWLSLSSSRNARSSNGCQKKAIPGEVNSMAHDRHTRSATPRLYLPAHTTARPLHTPMRLPGRRSTPSTRTKATKHVLNKRDRDLFRLCFT